jgi:hypothetical protein
VKANGEIISTIPSLRGETVFARPTNMHHASFDSIPMRRAHSQRAADNLHRIINSETIITRALKYSVSHFIDCNPVARRLCASLIDFSKAATQTRE